MRTCIKAWMSLNLGQIPPLTMELAALERLKNRRHHFFSVAIDPILFKLADNEDMHNILDEFEFRPDRTTDHRVSCPWASKKYPYRPYNEENGVSTFSLLFLIGSFWYFHVTRTSIKAWMSLNFLKWDLTLAHWTQVSDRCPLGYLLSYSITSVRWFCWAPTIYEPPHDKINKMTVRPAKTQISLGISPKIWVRLEVLIVGWPWSLRIECIFRMASAQSDESLCCALSG